jgi:hypothetical protein
VLGDVLKEIPPGLVLDRHVASKDDDALDFDGRNEAGGQVVIYRLK